MRNFKTSACTVVKLCIKKRDERTDEWTNAPEAICPSNFFEAGGIQNSCFLYMFCRKQVVNLFIFSYLCFSFLYYYYYYYIILFFIRYFVCLLPFCEWFRRSTYQLRLEVKTNSFLPPVTLNPSAFCPTPQPPYIIPKPYPGLSAYLLIIKSLTFNQVRLVLKWKFPEARYTFCKLNQL